MACHDLHSPADTPADRGGRRGGARAGQAEISYQFLPEHWGQGYGREAVSAVLGWAFEAIVPVPPVVVAVTQAANKASRRLLESVGMTAVGTFEEFGAPQVMYSVDQTSLVRRRVNR